jgi:hypothetical protein
MKSNWKAQMDYVVAARNLVRAKIWNHVQFYLFLAFIGGATYGLATLIVKALMSVDKLLNK